MENWHDFYTATAGAAAALIGLIFVGISISLNKILTISSLPNRALGSIILLLCILIISILALIPEHNQTWLGYEIIFIGASGWVIVSRSDIVGLKQLEKRFKPHNYVLAFVNQIAVLTYIICGILLILKIENAEFLIVAAFIISFIKSASDSWVLLIEINR